MAQPCTLSIIVAVADNGVIGVENKIPWKCSSDMKYFRKITMGKPVIMGRKTWESLGKPLTGRKNIVLTRNPSYQAEGASLVSSTQAALDIAECSSLGPGGKEIMIIGGKGVYDAFFDLAERIYLTLIHLSPNGDTLFATQQQLHQQGWREISRQAWPAGERDEADMSFLVLDKVKKP